MTITITKIAVGIILNQNGETFIAERKLNTEYAGFLEFPGGKVEDGETVETALQRELSEEVGIAVTQFEHYERAVVEKPNKQIQLYFFKVLDWQHTPYGKEGQKTAWIPIASLNTEKFPPANQFVIHKLQAEYV